MAILIIDTNILLSAFLSTHISPPALCLDMVMSKRHDITYSKEILEEYKEVLARPKFQINPVLQRSFITFLTKNGNLVTPKKKINLCKDSDDNIFLEAAYAGKARYLITGNLRHFPSVCTFIEIVSAKQFIDIQESYEVS